MGYRTTAIGWLHKESKPAPNKHPQLTLAKKRPQRQLTELIIDNEHLLYSQRFPGSANVIPDILSMYWHLDDGKKLNLLTQLFPTQLHPYLRLSHVPRVIEYFL